MGKAHNPRRGSRQFWPRKRSTHSLAKVGAWAESKQAKPLGFVGYKAGMTHILGNDNRPKSMTKGELVNIPVTIIDCPPMIVYGVSFYKHSKKVSQILTEKFDKNLSKKIKAPKKGKKIEDIKDYDDLRLIIHTQPALTAAGTKKPKLLEIVIGGTTEEKLAYAKEILGKPIKIADVFEGDATLDVHGVTNGKGFQGTVKRYGVSVKQHKGEKTKRGIGNLGAWTPKRVDFTVAQPGKMGYHLRTEYNKQIVKIGENGSDVDQKGGIQRYGLVKNNYLLVKGSIPGPKKRALVFTKPIRPNKKFIKNAYEVVKIAQ